MTTTPATRAPYEYANTGHMVDPADVTTYPIYEYTRRDKYGRTVRHFEQGCSTLVVMVTLPRRMGWIVNDWVATRLAPADHLAHAHEFRTEQGATRKQARDKALELVAAHRPNVPVFPRPLTPDLRTGAG
jgi:hypothetical protein